MEKAKAKQLGVRSNTLNSLSMALGKALGSCDPALLPAFHRNSSVNRDIVDSLIGLLIDDAKDHDEIALEPTNA